MARAIKHFDRVLLVTEWRDLMGGVRWAGMVETAEPPIQFMSRRLVSELFMERFNRLWPARNR
jgi:hypothetical protein